MSTRVKVGDFVCDRRDRTIWMIDSINFDGDFVWLVTAINRLEKERKVFSEDLFQHYDKIGRLATQEEIDNGGPLQEKVYQNGTQKPLKQRIEELLG